MIACDLSFRIFFVVDFVILAFTFKKDGCHLQWNATYHLNGRVPLLQINETWMDTLGHCIASSSDNQNYIFRFQLDTGICYRCVAIFNVHPNLLQYKQSECIKQHENSNNDIDNVCRFAFRGDTRMKTLFRSDAKSEQCPFQPPFNFTYAIQDGSCTSRISSVTSCSGYGKYRFHYEACPELPNTETHVDELECIAHWNSFGIDFFAVRITNSSITGSNIIFRCFIHQKTPLGGHMGISADSSCDELTDLTYASTRIDYTKGLSVKSRCHFPSFLIHSHNSSIQHKWISMTAGSISHFYSDKWIETMNGMNQTISLCLHMEDIGNVRRIMVYKITQHCINGYQCIKIKRRHKNVMEITYGEIMDKMPLSCNTIKVHTVDTIVFADAQIIRCPVNRQHFVDICKNPIVLFGCTYEHELIIQSNCNDTLSEKYLCIGYWRENELEYIVSKNSDSSELVCHIYSSHPDGIIHIQSYRRASCHLESLQKHLPYYNFTFSKYDSCTPRNGLDKKIAEIDSLLVAVFIIHVTYSYFCTVII